MVKDMADQEVFQTDSSLQITVPKNVLEVDGIDNSILTVQSGKRASVSGVNIEAGKVEAVYDNSLILNGNTYGFVFDNSVKLKYTPDSSLLAALGNDATKLKFYALAADGSSQEMTGSFDSATNSFTFSQTKLDSFAVVNTTKAADEDNSKDTTKNTDNNQSPSTGDQHTAIPAIAATAGVAAFVLTGKRRKTVK